MSALMKAKVQVQSVELFGGNLEQVKMTAVSGKLQPDGKDDDNTYAKYTPSGRIELTINNPDLAGKIRPGKKFYVTFDEVPEQ